MKRFGMMVIACAALLAAAGTGRAAVDRQAIIKEIQAAFDTWSKIPCTNIKFDYKGELVNYATEKPGALLVYIGYDSQTWARSDAFFSESHPSGDGTGVIERGIIGLNAYKWDWTIGAERNKLDIRTAITRLIPAAIGFYIGPDPLGADTTGLLDYNMVDYSPPAVAVMGAQYSYTQTGCTKPPAPPVCGKSPSWAIDGGGPPVDKGVLDRGSVPDAPPILRVCLYNSKPADPSNGETYHWNLPIPWYLYVPDKGRLPGGQPVVETDAGLDRGKKSDLGGGGGTSSGCCRVSHADTSGALPGSLVVLALLGGLLAAGRRRRPK